MFETDALSSLLPMTSTKRSKIGTRHDSLKRYQRNVLKIDTSLMPNEEIGELHGKDCAVSIDHDNDQTKREMDSLDLSSTKRKSLREAEDKVTADCKEYGLPTVAELHQGEFG